MTNVSRYVFHFNMSIIKVVSIYPWQACIIDLPAVSLLIPLLICYTCLRVFLVVSITTAYIKQSFFDLYKSVHKIVHIIDNIMYTAIIMLHDTFRHRVICLLCFNDVLVEFSFSFFQAKKSAIVEELNSFFPAYKSCSSCHVHKKYTTHVCAFAITMHVQILDLHNRLYTYVQAALLYSDTVDQEIFFWDNVLQNIWCAIFSWVT